MTPHDAQRPLATLPLYATRAEREALQRLQQQAPTAEGSLALAWLDREADPARVHAWLEQTPPELAAHPRLALLRVEMQLLREGPVATLPAAQALLTRGDLAGSVAADLQFLLYRLAEQGGRSAERLACIAQAEAEATAAGDARRQLQFASDGLRSAAFGDLGSAWQAAMQRLPQRLDGLSDDCAAPLADCWGVMHGFRAEYAESLDWLRLCFERSRDTGQRRRALVAASNLGYMLTQSGQLEAALHWLREGLALASGHYWPALEGGLLINLAQAQRELAQLDAARDSLQDAFAVLAAMPQSRNLCAAWGALGRLELACERAEPALQAYRHMATLPSAQAGDLRLQAGLGGARALLALQQPQQALQQLDSVLQAAQAEHSRAYEVEALGLRADALELLGDARAGEAFALALERAATLPHYQAAPQLLEAAARHHAQRGEHARAYALALQANQQRQQQFSDTTQRAFSGLRAELTRTFTLTATAQTEMQLHRLQRERQAALSGLVAGVAHEINTPVGNALLSVTSLQAQVQALQAGLQGEQPLRRSTLVQGLAQLTAGLRIIDSSLQRTAELTRTFKLVASDPRNERRAPFELAAHVAQCLRAMAEPLQQAQVEVTMAIDAQWQLDSYPEVLRQVLFHLLGNALAHAYEEQPQRRLWIEAAAGAEGQLRLSLRDNGIGIAPALQARLFEPFFTTKFGRGGSGLGLSIALNLTEQVLGGRLQLSSEPGQGACFTLELPLRAPEPLAD